MEITEFEPGLKKQVALMDFSAPWWGPCRQMAPIISMLTEKYKGRAIKRFVGVQSSEILEKKLDAVLTKKS